MWMRPYQRRTQSRAMIDREATKTFSKAIFLVSRAQRPQGSFPKLDATLTQGYAFPIVLHRVGKFLW